MKQMKNQRRCRAHQVMRLAPLLFFATSLSAADNLEVLWTRPAVPWSAVAFSPDGTYLASVEGGVFLWQVSDGALVREISGAFGGLNSVAFSPDTWRLAAGDGKVYVWNVWDGGRVWSQRAAGDVTSVTFAPDGRLASWSSDQQTIQLWNTADGTSLPPISGHQWSLHNVAFSPDGTLVASGGDSPEFLVKVLAAADGTAVWTGSGHTGRVRTVAFAAEGALLATAGDDAEIRFWRATDGAALATFTGHTNGIWKIAMAPNGTLASIGGDDSLKLWSVADGALLGSYAIEGIGSGDVEFSPDGSLLAYAAGGQLVVARNPAPAVVDPPRSQTRFVGQSVRFHVTASGSPPLDYQWRHNGVDLPGATNATLILSNLTPADAGRYSVAVANPLSSVVSPEARLTVLPLGPAAALVDPSFDPTADGELPGPAEGRASISGFALQPDGKTIVVGQFTAFNGWPRSHIARLHPDRTLDEQFAPRIGTHGSVRTVALQADGQILVGGTFTTIDAQPRFGLARLHPDGTLDTGFRADTANANVGFVDVQPDGKIWLGGNFRTVAGVSSPNLARLNVDGTVDTAFVADSHVAGDYDFVTWIHPLPDGRVLVGGHFESQRPHGGLDQNLLRLQSNGGLDSSFQCDISGLQLGSAAVRPDGAIIAGGMLHSWTGGSHYFCLVELTADGATVREFPPDAIPAMVTSVLLEPDGKVVIGGAFSTICGVARNGVARLLADGTLDPGFDPGTAFPPALDPSVLAMARQPDGRLWVGTEHAGRPEATYALASLQPNGQPEPGFAPRLLGDGGAVTALALEPDGRILVGGGFTSFNGQSRNQLARIGTDGALDPGFVPAVPPAFGFHAFLRQPDGRILVGGYVDSGVAAPFVHGLLRLNLDGSEDSSFRITPGVDGGLGLVRCIALQTDGKILIGGEFILPPRGLARLNPDGSTDSSFQPPNLPAWDEEGVHAVAVLSDGRILIGGDFGGVLGGLPSTLARLNADGSVDGSFDLGVVLHGSARRFVPTSDGGWVVAGVWVETPAGLHSGLLRLDAQGNLESVMSVQGLESAWPVAVTADGTMLTGGSTVFRIAPDGIVDRSFGVRLEYRGVVNVAAVQPNGRVVLGGEFRSVNGLPARNLVRLNLASSPRLPFVERRIGPQTQVTLVAQPQPGTSRYAVIDQPSAGPVDAISDGGHYDTVTGCVVFGPFADDQPRTLSYHVVLRPGTAGVMQLQGTATADGVTTPVLGDPSLRVWEFPPPPLWVEMRSRPLSAANVLQVWRDGDGVCQIEVSTNLVDWTTAGTVTCSSGLGEFTLPEAPAAEHRFYRARE
ncbi:MAG: immunoglobulin domain-containing protein [Verrucomicrobia bacterium]|nr:immunoglobulin domain-containing protein [Verrucomicrobiota bacterium]